MTGIEPRPQRWEARVLPLCHRGPRRELSLGTARKAHAVVLQEMEKGRFTWSDTDLVEKCKKNTQRMLQTVKSTTTSNTQVCVFCNKGKCKNDSDHVSSGILYQHCCSYCYKEKVRTSS